ncbi:MBL fold metallo-hydrolase [Qaidamihabitans albus]|uniref:MBL fold metallo-hydrolase n=1 Tax=Qaidamihabitans albus TaxID=2795733 RepID=UPI0018F26851|nr:MBL fold metallo-hydrolase [Qaidamihabitans albus]
MRAVLLGTKGGPRLLADRCGPGQLIEQTGHTVLVDAGEGVVQQIVRSGRSLADLDAVFITHHHCDHNVALGNVLMGYWVSGGSRPLTVYGPPPLDRVVERILAAHEYDITTRVADEGRVDLRELVRVRTLGDSGDSGASRVETGPLTVTAVPVSHPPVHALGYRFTGTARGSSIVVSGDTAPCRSLVELAHGAELLIHEVLHPDFIRPAASNTRWADLERHLLTSHTSVYELGAVAAAAGVGTLVMTHFVPATGVEPRRWLEPVQERFGGRVLLGHDLMHIDTHSVNTHNVNTHNEVEEPHENHH